MGWIDIDDERQRSERERKRHGATASRDTAEVRAVVVTFVALALFVYLVGFIVLPFVVAGIIAYICTPLLDWLAGRTGLPRPLLAVLLFLLLVGLAGITVAVAGRHLVDETGSTVTDLQGTLDRLLHRAADGEPLRLFGRPIDLNGIARTIGDRIHGWFSRPDRLMLVAGFGFAAVVGTFLTVVLLCYFLVSGKSVARGLFWLVPPSRRRPSGANRQAARSCPEALFYRPLRHRGLRGHRRLYRAWRSFSASITPSCWRC